MVRADAEGEKKEPEAGGSVNGIRSTHTGKTWFPSGKHTKNY